MNDLQTVYALLNPDDPAQDVIDRSRHQLQVRIRGGRTSRNRTAWLGVGIGGLAAAAAVTVAIAAIPATPVNGPPAKVVSGQDILLQAAVAAERSPQGTGRYWYVKVTVEGGNRPSATYENWVKPDGHLWSRGAKTKGKVMSLGVNRPKPFSLVAVDLTLEQLRALPTDPDALKAWIAEATKHTDARTSAGKFTAADQERATFESLISLVSTLPAPPQVRAAAFRAIAAYPGVRNLGPVPGGQGLQLPDHDQRLVVDPASGRVNGSSVFVTMDGAEYIVDAPATAKIDAEWTDTLPE